MVPCHFRAEALVAEALTAFSSHLFFIFQAFSHTDFSSQISVC